MLSINTNYNTIGSKAHSQLNLIIIHHKDICKTSNTAFYTLNNKIPTTILNISLLLLGLDDETVTLQDAT